MAKTCRWIGQFEEAIQAFKQALVLGVTDYFSTPHQNLAETYHDLGKQHFDNGNYPQAIECYHNAIVTDSSYKEVYYDLAVVNDEVGRYELAIRWYGHLVPRHIQLVKPGYESAIRWYSDVKRSSDYIDLHYRLGKACHRVGRYQEAVEAYQKAINHQITIMEAYDEARFEVEMKSVDMLDPPPENPKWWTDVFRYKESACHHKPLQETEIEGGKANEKLLLRDSNEF